MLKKECQEMHERMKVMEVKLKNQELQDEEIKKLLHRLSKIHEKYQNEFVPIKELIAQHEIKIKKNCEKTAFLERVYWRILIGGLMTSISIIFFLLEKIPK